MRKRIDLTGKQYNDLKVLGFSHKDSQGRSYWRCQNEKGETITLRSDYLKCEQSRLRRIWHGMINRCENPMHNKYYLYGEKGIKVCTEWRDNFQVFYEWAVSHGYKNNLTIDRIEGDKGYTPENCRWVDKFVQANNTERNHLITYNGETHTMAEWARIKQIPYQTFAKRINKLGWSVEKALTTP